jgi:hypothetical protein
MMDGLQAGLSACQIDCLQARMISIVSYDQNLWMETAQ